MNILDEYRKRMSIFSTPNKSYGINRYKKIVVGKTKKLVYKNGGYQYKPKKIGSCENKILVL